MPPFDRCPECGSKNARWRERTKRDVLQQWLSYVFDGTIGKLIAGSVSQRPYSQSAPGSIDLSRTRGVDNYSVGMRAAINETLYDAARDQREFHIGLTTPRRFWRCPDCTKEGHVYDFELVEQANRDAGR